MHKLEIKMKKTETIWVCEIFIHIPYSILQIIYECIFIILVLKRTSIIYVFEWCCLLKQHDFTLLLLRLAYLTEITHKIYFMWLHTNTVERSGICIVNLFLFYIFFVFGFVWFVFENICIQIGLIYSNIPCMDESISIISISLSHTSQ